MIEIPEYLTQRSSFRNSKSSKKMMIEGRHFFLSSTKKNSNATELYDISTGILVAVSVFNIDGMAEWAKNNIDAINERLSEYEYKEPDLFS